MFHSLTFWKYKLSSGGQLYSVLYIVYKVTTRIYYHLFKTFQILQDEDVCNHYTEQTGSYGNCIEKAFYKEMYKSFGCLPPWITPSIYYDVCPMTINDFYGANRSYEMPFKMYDLLSSQGILDYCKQPCMKMDIQLEQISQSMNGGNTSGM